MDTPTHHKDWAYDKVITSITDLEKIADSCALEFAPNFLEAVQQSTPPSVELFKQLPADSRKIQAQRPTSV